jgi:hypothetical protein
MKYCLHLSRLATAAALGAAFTASNGPAVGVTLGVAVAAALYVARVKAC